MNIELTGSLHPAHINARILHLTIQIMRRRYAPDRMEDKLAFVFKALSEPWQPSENVQAILTFGMNKRRAMQEACARLGVPHDGLHIWINGR